MPRVAEAARAEPAAAAKPAAAAEPAFEVLAAPQAVPGDTGDAAPGDALELDPSTVSPRAGSLDQPAALASAPDEPASDADALDLIDPSSPTAAFFRREEESFPPLAEVASNPDDHADERLVVVHQLSPETLARRARLRRIVAGVAGLAGVISVAVVAKAVLSSKPSSPAPVTMAAPAPRPSPVEAKLLAAAGAPSPAQAKAPAQVDPALTEPAAKGAGAVPDPVKAAAEAEKAEAEKAAAEKAAAAKAEAERAAAEKAEAERAAAEKAEAEKAEAPAASPEDAGKLKKEALSFLNRGRYKDAIEASRAAIAVDPTDALPYLYLGSALQDTGKWKDGLAAYSDCVRNATKGPIHECRAMGGRK
ncbi:hypothetical protein WME90_39955 [Sorangium sp. So ce375]|uniref:tetratricopeptide repeat protein n=1 Tax=Sorangium sp. So ce375 TaxID=3133306 RepID=UPI003F5AFB9E